MSTKILEIDHSVVLDDGITHYEYHTHTPYGNNDEIRVRVHQQNVFLLAGVEVYRLKNVG